MAENYTDLEDIFLDDVVKKSSLSEKYKIIGQVLKAKRIEYGLTTKELADGINLKEKYIQMIEDGDCDKIEGRIYIYGYIKAMAVKFNIDSKKTLEFLEYYRRFNQSVSSANLDVDGNNQYVATANLSNKKNSSSVKIVIFIIIILCIVINILKSKTAEDKININNIHNNALTVK